MVYKIVPSDFTVRLARIQAELSRRNGNGNLSGYASIAFADGDPVVGDLITEDHFNKLLTGLAYINSAGLPSDAIAGDGFINSIDIMIIDSLLESYEAQPRSAISNNDCESLCSGMCVDQCTTTCSTTCTSDCSENCSNNCTGDCTGTCKTGCSGCTGTCTGNCTSCSGCTGSCSGTCTADCGYCTGTCRNACAIACADGCTNAESRSLLY